MAETIMMVVVITIAGLGLCGASAAEVNQSLQDAGYNMTSAEVQHIYEYANDPEIMAYVQQNNGALIDAYNNANSLPGASSDIGLYGAADELRAEDPDLFLPLKALFNPSFLNVGNQYITVPGTSGVDPQLVSSKVYSLGNDYRVVITNYGIADTEFNGSYPLVRVDVYDSSGNLVSSQACEWNYPSEAVCIAVPYCDENGLIHVEYRYPESPADASNEHIIDVSAYLHGDDAVKSDDTYDIAINPDGTITLPDGTTIGADEKDRYVLPDGTVIQHNPDDTYTIGDDTYTPTIDITNEDLIKEILGLEEKIAELEFEKDATDKIDDLVDSAAEGIEPYNGEMSELMAPTGIAGVFPFCIPFDFVRGIKLLSSDPVAPRFEIPFTIPAFGSYPGSSETIVFDMSEYTSHFVVVRWFTTLIFMVNLGFVSTKIVKGAGA